MLEKTFPAEVSALPDAMEMLESALDEANCPMATSMQICMAFEELFVNIAHYAYGTSGGTVTVKLDMSEGLTAICLMDKGIPFDPLAKEDPDVTLMAEDRQIGGLGIYLVKKTMDEVSYERKENQNIVTMKKRF
ncbi:MAG: ATP-binding protein [Oscillibacter sp.]|nr:ATP-binding protein [Oscillibacter sp.]